MTLAALSRLGTPVLRLLAPERAHEAALSALELGLYPRPVRADDPMLRCDVFGFALPNPVAIAAGFDKDARVSDAVLGLGCGFAEVGSITPKAQPGNPQPRIFRLSEDRGIINRLGFNNGGSAPALVRLKNRKSGGVVGVNVGANKESDDRAADYVAGLNTFYGVAGYFMVNVSSPNTPGLRDLQAPAELEDLLSRLFRARHAHVARGCAEIPIIVKIAPDIAEDDLEPILGKLVAMNVDGIAVSNTTLSRPGLKSRHAMEAGGLSGRPLFHRSTVMLARVYELTGGRIPLVGIGGVDSGARAVEKVEAGATLVQLYSGLIYEGLSLIDRIKVDLARTCQEKGVTNFRELVGTQAGTWAAKPLDG